VSSLELALSSLAEQDLIGIARYTLDTWGERQLEKYRSLLNQAFLDLARDPKRSRTKPRPELFSGCRSYHVGSHIILYRVNEDRIEIARVLHESMELERHVMEFRGSEDEA
jgi:toxin ParE1/3/4